MTTTATPGPRFPLEDPYPFLDIAGAMPDSNWPPVPDDVGAQLLAMQFQFERSQWWGPEELHMAQDRQLDALLAHAARTVPYYRHRWTEAGHDLSRISASDFPALPLVARSDLNARPAEFETSACPPRHGRVYQDCTSGSMGIPLQFKATELHSFFWHAFVLRDHLWHKRDLSAKLAVIRHGVAEGETRGWGGLLDRAVKSGRCANLPIVTDVGRQLEWLLDQAPAYLLTYPSNLRALLRLAQGEGIVVPGLREVRTFGEYVPGDLSSLVDKVWGVPMTDAYSSQECGYIALQCPQGDGYHVMSENLRVEVLREDGQACVPGETGRVVITTLHNFAMPLIRYVLGDFAELGAPCACGRGLLHLNRIMGRQRNLIRLPDGRQVWPIFGVQTWLQETPIRQIRFVQRQIDGLEGHYVMDRDLGADEIRQIDQRIHQSLGWPLPLKWIRCESMSAGPTGKFEDVICLVPDIGER